MYTSIIINSNIDIINIINSLMDWLIIVLLPDFLLWQKITLR